MSNTKKTALRSLLLLLYLAIMLGPCCFFTHFARVLTSSNELLGYGCMFGPYIGLSFLLAWGLGAGPAKEGNPAARYAMLTLGIACAAIALVAIILTVHNTRGVLEIQAGVRPYVEYALGWGTPYGGQLGYGWLGGCFSGLAMLIFTTLWLRQRAARRATESTDSTDTG